MKLDMMGLALTTGGVQYFTVPTSRSGAPTFGSSFVVPTTPSFVRFHETARAAPPAMTMRAEGAFGRAWRSLRPAAQDPSATATQAPLAIEPAVAADPELRQSSAGQSQGEGPVERQGQGYAQAAAVAEDAGAAAALAEEEQGGRKKVMILMSDTGGGHRASAIALEDAFNELFPGMFECEIVDIWTDHGVWPYNKFVPAYKFLAKHPNFWRFFWYYGKNPVTRWMQEKTTRLSCFDNFHSAIEACSPDLVVSVHPLCQDIPLRVLDKLGDGTRKTPFVTVVTDLGGAHPLWFDKKVDLCFVPSDPVRQMAQDLGLMPHQLRQYGLPLRSDFWAPETRPKAVVRKSLGLDPSLPTTLVVGGGDGVGGLLKVADALGYSLGAADGHGGGKPTSQLVVVCGSNAKTKAQLEEKVGGGAYGPGVRVVPTGFVRNMADYMAAADCIVTKARNNFTSGWDKFL